MNLKIFYKNKFLSLHAACNLAFGLHSSGNIDEALFLYEKILKIDVLNHKIYNLIADIFYNKGDLTRSINNCLKAIEINPLCSEYYLNLADSLKKKNLYVEAIINYDKCLELNPKSFSAFCNKGNTLTLLNDHFNAIKNFDKAILLNPNNPIYYNNKATALIKLYLYDKALECCEYSLQLNSKFSLAYYNKALIFQETMKLDEAILTYNKALNINPILIDAHINLGKIYFEQSKFDLAISHFKSIISLDQFNLSALYGLGLVYYKLNLWEESKFYFYKCLNDHEKFKYSLGFYINIKRILCDWSELDYLIDLIPTNFKNITPFIALNLIDEPRLHLSMAASSRNDHEFVVLDKTNYISHKKIKIAYYSSEFCYHPISIWLIEQIENHNKEVFEVFGFSLQLKQEDAMTKRYKAGFDHFYNVENSSVSDIVSLSRHLQIDIAVDIMGLTEGSKPDLFDLRLAPIQVNHIGFPSSSGSKNIDFIITDRNLIPADYENFFTEKIVFIKFPYTYDRERKLSSTLFKREDYSLPNDVFIFTCQNSLSKITPEVFDLWISILIESPNSILWLQETNKIAKENLILRASYLGLDTNRLIFTPRETVPREFENTRISNYLSSYQLADLFLDTFPYNAGTTCVDALFAGLPILTKRGVSIVSRLASSALEAIEVTELITTTNQEYKELAIALANNNDYIKEIKAKISLNFKRTKLFDVVGNCKEIDKTYQLLHSNYLNNTSKDSF